MVAIRPGRLDCLGWRSQRNRNRANITTPRRTERSSGARHSPSELPGRSGWDTIRIVLSILILAVVATGGPDFDLVDFDPQDFRTG